MEHSNNKNIVKWCGHLLLSICKTAFTAVISMFGNKKDKHVHDGTYPYFK